MLPDDPTDRALLDGWQRDFPLVARPFAAIGHALELTEAQALLRLERMVGDGVVGRVGAVCRPNTVAASTLAAMRVPEARVEDVARLIGAEDGVNHSYEREDDWNLWFVATAPDRAGVDVALARIAEAAALPVLDLRLVTPYHIDLGFPLDGGAVPKPVARPLRLSEIRAGDRQLIGALCQGLPLVARPWAAVGEALGMTGEAVIARVRALLAAGVLTRVGLILRHRPLGWRANAMTVWSLPPDGIDETGRRLAAQPGVTLCYRRRPDPAHWPFNLYCMVHGRSRDETLATLDCAAEAAGLGGRPRRVLFSRRCFRQRGALIAREGVAA